jgi:DNA helicase-2/ATP-dependent DNA helicase PcrA
MTEVATNSIDSILSHHADDNEQLNFITTSNKKVIVQAPAGYGKTRTMVSKLAYILAKNQILSPKKILALTFSVNAAYKIKKDVIEQLPNILQGNQGNNTISLNSKISVSNYHGFCRKVLSRYGYLLHEQLRKVNEFTSFDDGRAENITNLGLGTTPDVIINCTNYSDNIKSSGIQFLRDHFDSYNNHALTNFIPNEYISFNSILTLTLKLFHEHPKILSFYQKLYPIIFIDEFQDTNFFGYTLLQKLITSDTHAYFMGDSLQRIYGFIGAIPNILQNAQEKYDMEMIELKNNYRFRHNPNMLLLDNNVRRNAENIIAPSIVTDAVINLQTFPNQDAEAIYVFDKSQEIIALSSTDKVAILFRNGFGNLNTQRIIDEFDKNGVVYFYGLFSDEDEGYKRFHFNCAKEFSALLKQSRLSKRTCKKHIQKIETIYQEENNPLFNSLIQLMEIFYERLYSEYSFILLDDEDKVILIKETFDGFGLKQYMEYVDSRIIISTIHGAKGLEWEYVIMPDMEQYSLPNWFGFCGDCSHKGDCQLHPGSANSKLIEEMSVFYVGFTRAKKQVYFSASNEGIRWNGDTQNRNLSCFLQMKGITIH